MSQLRARCDGCRVTDLDLMARSTLLSIAATILDGRRARRWSQRRLARAAGVSQSMVCAIERARLPDLPIAPAIRLVHALDIPFDLRLATPLSTRPIQDAAHARCVAYTARRLEAHGFLVKTEVEVGGRGGSARSMCSPTTLRRTSS